MVKHFIQIIVITAIITLCIFFPYIPGDYDGFSATLSTMAQLLGIAGLLYVPIGIIWLIAEIITQGKQHSNPSNKNLRFAKVTLIISGLVALIISLGAFARNNLSLAVIILIISFCVIIKLFSKLKQMKSLTSGHFNPIPFYLIGIPVMVVLIRFTLIVPATQFSRSYAIKQSERFINDIEAYYDKHGHYPQSLLSVHEDYKPSITGIERYYYEPNGAAYNLYFEQFSDQLGVKEIVMYNKLDEHEMTSHNQDLLQIAPESIFRGYHVVKDLPNAHWKYFWFD